MATGQTQALVVPPQKTALTNAITLWAASCTRAETGERDDKLQEKIAVSY